MTNQFVTVLEYDGGDQDYDISTVEVYSTDNKARHRIIDLAASVIEPSLDFPADRKQNLTVRAQRAAAYLRGIGWTIHITRQRVR